MLGLNNEKSDAQVFSIDKIQDAAFQPLDFGEIKPLGWLKTQMQKDLDGFIGNLDALVPDLMADSIYGKDRLTKAVKSKNVGNIGEPMDPQYLWWNSETQSNWRDGYIRNALLFNDKRYLDKVEKYIQYILSTQDADGYLGIYANDLRYNFKEENGEMWAKTTLLRGLLAYYEATKSQRVFDAVKRAVENVMVHYPIHQSSPFKSSKTFVGGVTHGLVFTDVLDRLYQITGDKKYWDYALFFYKDFSENTLSEDAQYSKLIDKDYKLKEHGAHTYEHLRPMALAYFASGNPSLKSALDLFLKRIETCTTPAGGPIGDEWIAQRVANASKTGYEYCSIHELMDAYCSLLQKTGDASFGDKIETMFFNAAQGARHPLHSAICYCKSDNSFEMTGTLNGEPQGKEKQTRFKYSPAHQDVAVCCVPNAGRISPYFVKSLWMRDHDGLVATLFCPSELNTKVKGSEIKITEETGYPFQNTIQFKVTANKATTFSIKIRKPYWAKDVKLNIDYQLDGQYIVIRKTWGKEEKIEVEFKAEIETKQQADGQTYFTRGALVYALPFEAVETQTKKFAVDGFFDFQYERKSKDVFKLVGRNSIAVFKSTNEKSHNIWESGFIETVLKNSKTNEKQTVKLVPIGATILRQVTFE